MTDQLANDVRRIVVIQTAFLGDVVLCLPLVQALKKSLPAISIDLVARPIAGSVAKNHPAIDNLIVYDKRGLDGGIRGFFRIRTILSDRQYDVALIPHRSIRSALLANEAGIPLRIGFDRSAGKWLLNRRIHYESSHPEYRRNLDLLKGIGLAWEDVEYPELYPGDGDRSVVNAFLESHPGLKPPYITVAPGSLWNTKRWLPERFEEVVRFFHSKDFTVVLIGGESDRELCETVASGSGGKAVSAAGLFTPLQSAEMIRLSRLLLCNDSAPLHLALGVGTPVAAIFGATTPSIGFAPYGRFDRVIENTGLACRPCSIHGGKECPIGTFECMNGISAAMVARTAMGILEANRPAPSTP